ncbi:MAG: hypothetical protein ACREX8_06205, partial [Gammaproteobacteria bacterium]
DRVSRAVTAMKVWIVRKFWEVIDWLKRIPGMISGAIGNLGGLLQSAGAALVQGFLNGIKAKWQSIVNWVRNGMADLRNLWPFSPAKEGPFSGRGYVTYSGAALTGDFATSIRRGIPGVVAAVRGVVGAAQGNLATATVGRGVLAPRAGVGQATTTRIVVDSAGSRLDDLLVEVLGRALRERGLGGIA